MKLERSIIAITGAGGGLGTGMARRFAAPGARLALLDFRADLLDGLVDELGHRVQAHEAAAVGDHP